MKIASKWSRLSITENRCVIVTHAVMAPLSTRLLSSLGGMLLPGLPLKATRAAHLLLVLSLKNPNGNTDQTPDRKSDGEM